MVRRFGEAPTAREVAAPPLYRIRESVRTVVLPTGRQFVVVERSRAGPLKFQHTTDPIGAEAKSQGGEIASGRPAGDRRSRGEERASQMIMAAAAGMRGRK